MSILVIFAVVGAVLAAKPETAGAAEGNGAGTGKTYVTSPWSDAQFPNKGFCDDLHLEYVSNDDFSGVYRDGPFSYTGPLKLTSVADGLMSPANSFSGDPADPNSRCTTPGMFPVKGETRGGQAGSPNSVLCQYPEGTYSRDAGTIVLNLYGTCTIWDLTGAPHSSRTQEVRTSIEGTCSYQPPAGGPEPDYCNEQTQVVANSLQCGSDDARSVGIADAASVQEGNTGTVPAVFKVRLDGPSCGVTTVSARTANGTAEEGSDFETLSTRVVLLPGQTEAALEVPVKGDDAVEPDETFFVGLGEAAGASVGVARATGTISNDDAPPPSPPPPPPPPPPPVPEPPPAVGKAPPVSVGEGGGGGGGSTVGAPGSGPTSPNSVVANAAAPGSPTSPISGNTPPPPVTPGGTGYAPTLVSSGGMVPTSVPAGSPVAGMSVSPDEVPESAPQGGVQIMMVGLSDSGTRAEGVYGSLTILAAGLLMLLGCGVGAIRRLRSPVDFQPEGEEPAHWRAAPATARGSI